MSNKRKLEIDFSDIIDTIYDKIDSEDLQDYLEEQINVAKNDPKMVETIEQLLKGPISSIIPLGNTFEEFEDNVRDGTVVKVVQFLTTKFRKMLESGSLENDIAKMINNVNTKINDTVKSNKQKKRKRE